MIVSSVSIYMLSLVVSLTFEVLKSIVKFGFKNTFFRRRAFLVKVVHYLIILVSIAMAAVSLKLQFFIGAAIVMLLLLIDLTLRTN